MMEVLKTILPDERHRVIELPVDSVKPNPYQPRRVFEPGALDELASSIIEFGVLQPISVRRIGSQYELIAGERRLRACKLVGLATIPAIIYNFKDDDSALLALLENLQREDLGFLEEAEAYEHLICDHGMTQEMVANRIGKKQSTVANKLRILKLSPDVKKIIKENNLTERHARALLKLRDEELQLELLKKICEKGLNVSQTEEEVERIIERITNPDQAKSKASKKVKLTKGFRDVRILVNTVKQAVDYIKKAGVKASFNEKDSGDYVEYTIKILKQA
jgi:ParB family chromosome partitioning protein